MVSLEWFLSPDLYSKPIDKHIHINNKKKNKPSWIYKTSTPFWLGILARRIRLTDEGYFKQPREKKIRKCGYSIKEVENQDLKTQRSVFLTTEKLTKSVTVFLIC